MKKGKSGFFSNIRRLLQIIRCAKRHKLIGSFLKIRKGYKEGISPKDVLKTSENLKDLAQRLRLFFQETGPTFIKFGQILSLQIDILPKEIYEELEKLQDKVPGFPYEEARKTIENELETSFENIFSEFSEQPVAAASLAQVHKAKLKTGELVAVKIQRPNIRKIIEKDISLIRFLSRFINLEKINLPREYLEKTINEFENFILTELDFKIEGRNMDRLSKMIKDKTIIPEVYSNLTTSKVLTMEWIDCTKSTNLKQIENWKLDKEEIISKIVETYLRQILIHGLYHADPHPANVGVTKKGKIVLFDYGAMGSIDLNYRKALIKMVNYMLELDSESYLEEFLKANKIKKEEVENYDKIVEEVDEVLEEYNKSIIPDYNHCAAKLANILNRNNIRDIHKYVVLTRTLVVLSSITKIYNFSDRDSLDIFKKVAKESMKKDFWNVVSLDNVSQQLIWANKNNREFLANPKQFLEKNMPKLKLFKDEEEKKEEEAKEKYRSYGIYKYPFFALIFLLAALAVYSYYPAITLYKYPAYTYLFFISGIIFIFSLFNFMYLDYKLDKRTEIYKYPFFVFLIIGVGIFTMTKKELLLLGYPIYYFVFGLALILILYSLIHLFRAIKHGVLKKIEKTVKEEIGISA